MSENSALLLSGILPLDLRLQKANEAKGGYKLLSERKVERIVPYSKLPHMVDHMSLEFMNLIDQDQLDLHNNQVVKIFTDGSKIGGGVGTALSF